MTSGLGWMNRDWLEIEGKLINLKHINNQNNISGKNQMLHVHYPTSKESSLEATPPDFGYSESTWFVEYDQMFFD